MQFQWAPEGPPPPIDPHSKAKLTVLRKYLHAYFDKLNVNPQREDFKLDLVDGFAGGGTFQDGNETLSGTPLIMLEEVASAQKRLNRNRAKPLHFDCRWLCTKSPVFRRLFVQDGFLHKKSFFKSLFYLKLKIGFLCRIPTFCAKATFCAKPLQVLFCRCRSRSHGASPEGSA